jgi:hypothetical protein
MGLNQLRDVLKLIVTTIHTRSPWFRLEEHRGLIWMSNQRKSRETLSREIESDLLLELTGRKSEEMEGSGYMVPH